MADIFVGDTYGPEAYIAFFEATDGKPEEQTPSGGYLYVSDKRQNKIIRHLEIYNDPTLPIKERDIQILWSTDGSKCAVAIWGRIYGFIDIKGDKEFSVLIKDRNSPGIESKYLQGFNAYLNPDEFLQARGQHWREEAKQYNPELQIETDLAPFETNFIRYEKGPAEFFGAFEDDGDTGYLYLYDAGQRKILQFLNIYDHSKKLGVSCNDVDVVWSEDYTKCGVIIWKKMRGIINAKTGREGRVKLETQDSAGITDKEWLKGFEYLDSSVRKH